MAQDRSIYRLGDNLVSVLVAIFCAGFCSLVTASGSALFPVPLRNVDAGVLASVAVCDVDQDGIQDLVGGNSAGLVVFSGNGDGTFGEESLVALAPGASLRGSLAPGDFNGDGQLDFAILQRGPEAIAVFIGGGDGTFQSPVVTPIDNFPVRMVAGDLNADHLEDVAITYLFQNTILLLLGRGNGTFDPPIRLHAQQPKAVVIDELDQHVGADLAILQGEEFQCDTAGCTSIPGGISILSGLGDGTFTFLRNIGVESPGSALAVEDATGDGVKDLLAGTNRSITVYPGDGNGNFGPARKYETGMSSAQIVVEDMNRDGDRDIVVVNWDSNDLSVLLADGEGGFQGERRYIAGLGPRSVGVGDFNADGAMDLVANSTVSNDFMVLLGIGDGTFPVSRREEIGAQPVTATIGDVDGSGTTDLLVGFSRPTRIGVFLRRNDLRFEQAFETPVLARPVSLHAEDLNDDGEMDLLSTEADFLNGGFTTFLGLGGGLFEERGRTASGGYVVSVARSDLNADGVTDIVATIDLCDGPGCQIERALMFYEGRPDGTFLVGVRWETPLIPSAIVAGDLNGDGFQDLVVGARRSNKVAVLLGDGVGEFVALDARVLNGVADSLVLDDFNGDGKQDLAYIASQSGVDLLLGNGDGTFQQESDFHPIRRPGKLIAGDLNSDRKLDLALLSDNTVCVLLGDGDGTFSAPQKYASGGFVRQLVLDDLNHDQRMDLIAVYSTDLSMRLLPSNWQSFNYNGVALLLNQGPFPVVRVQVVIYPGGGSGPLNTRSKGVTPVALLGSTTLDSTKIDAATIRLNGASVRRQVKSGGGPRCREKDVNQDGFMDLLCYIETNEIEINSGQTKLTLEARTIEGLHVFGETTIRLVPAGVEDRR